MRSMNLSSVSAETGTAGTNSSDTFRHLSAQPGTPAVRGHRLDAQRSGRAARLGWIVLGYNVFVILWGAFVRASGSGAGCGRHWPLCNGEVIPQPKSIATVIEAGHRLTSGIAVIGVIALAIATFRAVPKGHRARKAAVVSTASIFGEALIGGGLVLFELVAHDASMKRGLSMILHLSNTFVLLAALALTAWWLREARDGERTVLAARRPALLRTFSMLALGGVILLGASGAVAALGDTLFPVKTLSEGLAQDLSPLSHVFLRLRLLHPVLALGTGLFVLGSAGLVRAFSPSPMAQKISRLVTALFVMQFTAGILNLTLLAPVPMQLVHLLLADAMWIALVLMAWEAWNPRAPAVDALLTSRASFRGVEIS